MSITSERIKSYAINRLTCKTRLDEVLQYLEDNVDDWSDVDLVWDVAQLDFDSVTSRDIRDFAQNASRIAKVREGRKSALIAPSDLVYGMMRMFQIMAEGLVNIELGVFRDEDSAIRWITSEPEERNMTIRIWTHPVKADRHDILLAHAM